MNSKIYSKMADAVVSGVGFPAILRFDLPALAEGVSMFSGAGGVILAELGGVPVTIDGLAAYQQRGRDAVTVKYRGNFICMSLEEAYARGLQENANWDFPTSAAKVCNHILSNIFR